MYDAVSLMEDLAHMAPGPELAALLSTLDYDQLAPDVRVEAMCAEARQAAHQQARLLTAVHKSAQTCRLGEDLAADEISFALHWTRQAADGQLGLACEVIDRLPAVHAALLAGVIDVPKARVIVDLTRTLEEALARQVVEKVLPDAPGNTTGELRARLRRLIVSVDPQAAANRQEEAVRERKVVCYPDPDGTATLLGMGLPAERAKAAVDHLDQLATRRPTAELARKVRLRDRTCRAPGCRMPAIRCDIDHRRDWQYGGESTVDNLCCLCHHHRLKHDAGWRYREIAAGVWAWTSPTTGRTYITPPEAVP